MTAAASSEQANDTWPTEIAALLNSSLDEDLVGLKPVCTENLNSDVMVMGVQQGTFAVVWAGTVNGGISFGEMPSVGLCNVHKRRSTIERNSTTIIATIKSVTCPVALCE